MDARTSLLVLALTAVVTESAAANPCGTTSRTLALGGGGERVDDKSQTCPSHLSLALIGSGAISVALGEMALESRLRKRALPRAFAITEVVVAVPQIALGSYVLASRAEPDRDLWVIGVVGIAGALAADGVWRLVDPQASSGEETPGWTVAPTDGGIVVGALGNF